MKYLLTVIAISVSVVGASYMYPTSAVVEIPDGVSISELAARFVNVATEHGVKLGEMSKFQMVPSMLDMVGGDTSRAQPIAYCTPDDNKVVVNFGIWDHLSDSAREQVIFHELGHCLLHRAHLDSMTGTKYGFSRKLSIMSSRLSYVPNHIYLEFHTEYMTELFDPARRGDLDGVGDGVGSGI